jgi:hypothetical protein
MILKLCSRPSFLSRVTVVPKDAWPRAGGGLPHSPIAHFPRGGSSFPVTFVCCGPVRRFEKAESGLDGRKPRFGHEIAVRRYRPVRKFGRLAFGFFDKRAAHAAIGAAQGYAA